MRSYRSPLLSTNTLKNTNLSRIRVNNHFHFRTNIINKTRSFPFHFHNQQQRYKHYRQNTGDNEQIQLLGEGTSLRPQYWMLVAGGLAISAGLVLMADGEDGDASEEDDDDILPGKAPSLRQRMIGNYENRIREMSAPEKIFEYFASQIGPDGEPRMTVEDFIASITHYDYDSGIGGAWARASNKQQDASSSSSSLPSRRERHAYRKAQRLFNLVDSDKDAMLSFSEYLFFVTLLSIPRHDAELAFRMFDENGNGAVDREEFQRMINAMMQSTPIGRQNRDKSVKYITQSLTSFFGQNGEKDLRREDFVAFIKSVHDTVTDLEFDAWDHKNRGWLPQSKFAMLLVANANQRQLPELAKRADKLRGSGRRVTLEQYRAFQRVLEQVDEVDKAMRLYITAGRPFTKEELQRTVKAVTGEELDPVVNDTIFAVFDTNGDGVLEENEFLRMMHLRANRGLDKKRDFGFTSFLSCYKNCVRDGLAW